MSTDPTPVPLPTALDAALDRRFERVVVFSGAGMSADSGIPTFRSGTNGLWSDFDPMRLATPQAWAGDRALVWGWYEWRRGLVSEAQPNAGHRAVGALQAALGRERVRVITQNVDDLHERGGASDVLHLHGSLFTPRCDRCGAAAAVGAADFTPSDESDRRLAPPRCARCEGHIRPGVVWFGESLDLDLLQQAADAISGCDLLLIVGTSGVVQPAAGLIGFAPPDAQVVELNPEALADEDRLGTHWRTTAATGLPAIAARVIERG